MNNLIYDYLFVMFIAWLAVYNLTPLIIKFAFATNFLDNPNARKVHKKAIPLLGGLSVFLGFLGLAVYNVVMDSGRTFDIRVLGFLGGALIIVIVGLIDDRIGMTPKIKMFGQVLSCMVFLYCNDLISIDILSVEGQMYFNTLFNNSNILLVALKSLILVAIPIAGLSFLMFLNHIRLKKLNFQALLKFIMVILFIGLIGYLFSQNYICVPLLKKISFFMIVYILWMVGLMNAFNFLDNMDGILSGMSGILAIGFYALSFICKTPTLASQSHFIALLSLAFAGAVFGFLPYNFNPARIFLGDAGSMFIGYFLSTMGILGGRLASLRMNSELYYLVPILLLSYAIFDISLVSYTRKRDGRHISEGGKDHSTHRIGNAMKSTKLTAIMIYLINLIIVLVTIIVLMLESYILLIIMTIIFSMSFLIFGRKLDQIPVVITKNQLKKQRQEK